MQNSDYNDRAWAEETKRVLKNEFMHFFREKLEKSGLASTVTINDDGLGEEFENWLELVESDRKEKTIKNHEELKNHYQSWISSWIEKSKSSVKLPMWSDVFRAAPNEILRSSLFTASSKKKPRRDLEDETICSLGGDEISFTGIELRQEDKKVWLQILHLARLAGPGERIVIDRNKFLNAIGKTGSGDNYCSLRISIDRLKASSLKISSKRLGKWKKKVGVSLIRTYGVDEKKNEIVIDIEPEIKALFAGNYYTRIYWKQYISLPTGLATWMHTYYATHREPYPVKLQTIAAGSGVNYSKKNDLARAVRRALASLQEVGFLKDYKIENGRVIVVRNDNMIESK